MEKTNCNRRVVITGMSMISPLGNDLNTSWEGIVSGRSGIGLITAFDTTEYTTKIAGEVKDFEPENFIDKKEVKKMDRFIHYAVACSKMALEESGLKIDESNAHRVGVWIGAGIGGLMTIEKYHTLLLENGPKKNISVFYTDAADKFGAGAGFYYDGRKRTECEHCFGMFYRDQFNRRRLQDNCKGRRGCYDSRRGGIHDNPFMHIGF